MNELFKSDGQDLLGVGCFVRGSQPVEFADCSGRVRHPAIIENELKVAAAKERVGFDRRGQTEGAAIDTHKAGWAIGAFGGQLRLAAFDDQKVVGRVQRDDAKSVPRQKLPKFNFRGRIGYVAFDDVHPVALVAHG